MIPDEEAPSYGNGKKRRRIRRKIRRLPDYGEISKENGVLKEMYQPLLGLTYEEFSKFLYVLRLKESQGLSIEDIPIGDRHLFKSPSDWAYGPLQISGRWISSGGIPYLQKLRNSVELSEIEAYEGFRRLDGARRELLHGGCRQIYGDNPTTIQKYIYLGRVWNGGKTNPTRSTLEYARYMGDIIKEKIKE